MTNNGWSEDRKLVEYRLDRLERSFEERIGELSHKLDRLHDAHTGTIAVRRFLHVLTGTVGGLISLAGALLAGIL